jgi:LuxR family maltose regulon positive regulatory protein
LQLADEQVEQSRQSSPIVGAVYINMGEVMREWNDLDAALHHVLKGIELGQPGGDLRAITIGHFALARVYQAQGDMERSDQAIQQAAQFAQQSNITWLISKVAAYQARLWLARNNLSAAVRWTQQCGLNLGDQIGFQREGEYAILARVIIAQKKPDEALKLLEWLLGVTETTGLMGSVIEILALQALALELQGDTAEATAKLERALSLAEPEGYIRLYIDEGPPMAVLLQRAASRGIAPHYVSQLLAAFPGSHLETQIVNHKSKIGNLIDPLSERELEVLQLIADGLSNREIAQELIIAPGTVKVHIKNIYSKLDVHNRTQAAARARELNLLS